MSKKRWMKWHSWLGLKLSLLMLVICITGTVAVLGHEIDWLINSDLRVTDTGKPINWDAMSIGLHKKYPERYIRSITRPLYRNFAAIGMTIDPFLGPRRVFVNPYTGEVTGDKAWYASVQRVMRDLHRYLLSPMFGIYLVGPFGLILLGSLITALMCYKKWWRGFFKLRINNGSRAFWGSLHKVTGLWSIWFVAVIAITGTWYLVEAMVSDFGGDIQFHRHKQQKELLVERNLIEHSLPPSVLINTAKAQFEEFTVSGISFPLDQNGLVNITGYSANALLVRSRSNQVSLDAVTGEIIGIRKTQGQSALEIWIDIADPLHFGNFSGFWVKMIWFIFGMIISGLCAVGIWLFLKRIKQRGGKVKFTVKVWGKARFLMYTLLLIPVLSGSYLFAMIYDLLPRARHIETYQVANADRATNLILGQRDNNYYLGINIDCPCLALPAKVTVVLNDDTHIKFKRNKDGFWGDTALLSAKQLNEVALIEWRYNDKMLLSYSISDIDFKH